jgi:hypothetical protein
LINFVQHEFQDENGTIMVRFKKRTTNFYRYGGWTSIQDFVFNDGTTVVPASLPPPNEDGNFVNTGLRAVAWTFSFLSILTALGFIYWTWRNKKTRVVNASQPFFLYMLSFGVILVVSTVFFLLNSG